MNYKKCFYIILVLMFCDTSAQETINANDPNSFIFGGDQGSQPITVDVLSIAIVDIEPDPGSGLTIGDGGAFEAGLPVEAGTGFSITNSELWLNYTYRASPGKSAKIYVSTNQPVPKDFKFKINIANVGSGGQFTDTSSGLDIKLDETERVIIDAFGSGYTGDGLMNGYQLQYTIQSKGGSLPSGFEILYRIQED